MAKTITLANLRTEVRRRADMEGSGFVTDSELTSYINNSATELRDILIQKFQDYYITSDDISIVSGTDTYNLAADFYKALGVDMVINSRQSVTMRPFMFRERNRYVYNPPRGYRYRILGDQVRVIPEPTSSFTMRIWYVPTFTNLSADGDTLDGVHGWEEYVIIDAAIKCLRKEESDTSALLQDKMFITKRIEEAADNRDVGEPQRVVDVTGTVFADSDYAEDYY